MRHKRENSLPVTRGWKHGTSNLKEVNANEASQLEKNRASNIAENAPESPSKPKAIARNIKMSYARLTKLDGRKPERL